MQAAATCAHKNLFIEKFNDQEDPRRTDKGNHRHKLSDILPLTISAIICGADNWDLVKTFGDSQIKWLKGIGEFSWGIPPADTLARVFSALDPVGFNTCFMDWIESVRSKTDNEVVAIDGKCIRGADPTKKAGRHPGKNVSTFQASIRMLLN